MSQTQAQPQPQAYGAGMAGGAFDPLEFIKRPQVIVRLVSLVFSIIVFGCISSGGYYDHHCQMMDDLNACRYGVGIGVLAFLFCIGFLILDAVFDNLSGIQHRKYAVMADMGISALWTFLWFVGFCYLTNRWTRRDETPLAVAHDGRGKDNIQASIAFSFFSIFTWAGLTFLAVRRYRAGASEAFTSGYQGDQQNQSSPYSSFPGSDSGDPYQQPPFSNQQKSGDIPDYQPPTY